MFDSLAIKLSISRKMTLPADDALERADFLHRYTGKAKLRRNIGQISILRAVLKRRDNELREPSLLLRHGDQSCPAILDRLASLPCPFSHGPV